MSDVIYRSAIEWALADRAADDRAANVTAIERTIAETPKPIPSSLFADRDAAVMALREACIAEGKAEDALREAARKLLDT